MKKQYLLLLILSAITSNIDTTGYSYTKQTTTVKAGAPSNITMTAPGRLITTSSGNVIQLTRTTSSWDRLTNWFTRLFASNKSQ